jgi:two-component system, cell cycle response regulator
LTENILIVEDDAFFREIFSGILEEDGYQVDTASSGNEALAMLAKNSYQLVVTDMMLQDISGLDILSRAKQMDSDIEVIVVTGYGNMESAIYALKNGARDYLVKPISHDEFKHVVRLTMEQRRMLDENQVLKEQIRLFQTSQTIANCIDIDRIQLLVLEATIKETGTERGFTCLHDAAREIFLMETKGISKEDAETINEALKRVYDWEKEFSTEPARVQITLPTDSAAGNTELILLPINNKTELQGVVVLLGGSTNPAPIPPFKLSNIRFLTEQSALAIENAGRYAMVKDLLNIDELTGLYNYRYLDIALERELRRSERFDLSLAVIFLDVDMLKVINDTYGHLIGSRVLKEVGIVLKKSVREVDVVIRYGGDEYTILLIETGRPGAAVVAERIRKTLEEHPFILGDNLEVKLTASLGFACFPEDTKSKLELLEMADRAMYYGKASGKNIVAHISASLPENH